jgi:hypothetical protein
MDPYNGYTEKQRNAIFGEIKRRRKKGDAEGLRYWDSKGPCEICGDKDCGDPKNPKKAKPEWHSEDYSPPYRLAPPATFIICSTCHSRLHKRFPDESGRPSDWPLFLHHLRSGGYGWEFTKLYTPKLRTAWQAQMQAGESVVLPVIRPRKLTGQEWWQTLTLDPESKLAAWARPRPWYPHPTTEEYQAALKLVRPTKDELALLRFHARFPKRSATMRQLAKGALASPSQSKANLLYGKLAHRLALALNWKPENREDGTPSWMTAIAEGWQPVDREFEWVMVPSLAVLYS